MYNHCRMSADDAIWCEKYRPRNLKDLVGNESIIDALLTYSKYKRIPNLLMTGSPGCGKTSAVQSLARECILPEGEYLEINSSDERGIDTVRNKLKLFSGKKLPESCVRIIFLDEADGMTHQAQLGLKALMDVYAGKVAFVLGCNRITCIHDAIVSRCNVFEFKPIPSESMCMKLREIAMKEKLETDVDAIAAMVPGDLRSAINILQMTALNGQLVPPIDAMAGESYDSEQVWPLDQDSIDATDRTYRRLVMNSLHFRSRCKDRYGIDKALQKLNLLEDHHKIDPALIRESIKILFGNCSSRFSTYELALSTAKLLAILRMI